MPYGNSKYPRSRDFKEHIVEVHDKNYRKWFKEWSVEFFKLNPHYLIYLGVLNEKYEGRTEPKPVIPKINNRRPTTSDWW
jgi:hypothetical protein